MSYKCFNRESWIRANEDHLLWLSDPSKGKQLIAENEDFSHFYGFDESRNFKHAIFKNCKFPRKCFTNVSLSNCSIINCDLSKTNFEEVNFSNSDLTGTNFSNQDIRNCNFTNTILKDIKIDFAIIDDNFRNALSEYLQKEKNTMSNSLTENPNLSTEKCSGGFTNLTIKDKFEIAYKRHQEWLEDKSKGERLNISDIDLSKIYDSFENRNFSNSICNNVTWPRICRNINFTNANLSGSSFKYCTTSELNFHNADLTNVNLKKCILKDCNFTNTIFNNTAYNSYTTGVPWNIEEILKKQYSNIPEKRLDSIEFDKLYKNHLLWLEDSTKGKQLDLSNCDLIRLSFYEYKDFSYSICVNTIFPKCCNANFEGAILKDADFRLLECYGFDGIKSGNFTKADLTNADFSDANIKKCNFTNAKLDGIITTRITADSSFLELVNKCKNNIVENFHQDITTRQQFEDAYKSHEKWLKDKSENKQLSQNNQLNISNLDLSKIYDLFYGRNFSHAICENTIFPDTERCNFTNTNLKGASFNGKNVEIDFRDLDLTDVNFRSSNLLMSTFKNCKLNINNFTNAKLSSDLQLLLQIKDDKTPQTGRANDKIFQEIEELKEQLENTKSLNLELITQIENSILENSKLKIQIENTQNFNKLLTNDLNKLQKDSIKAPPNKALDELSSETSSDILSSTSTIQIFETPIKQFQTVTKNAIKIAIGNQSSNIIHNNIKKLFINIGISKDFLDNFLVDSCIKMAGPQIFLQLVKTIPELKISDKLKIVLNEACVSSIANVSSETIEMAVKLCLPTLNSMFKELEGESPKKKIQQSSRTKKTNPM